jgi:hypothetical protein
LSRKARLGSIGFLLTVKARFLRRPLQELKLDQFFAKALRDRRGSVEWAKVIELLAVNRLCEPESELGVHQRWYGTTAMDVVLGTDDAVAAKDRLYRALDTAQLLEKARTIPVVLDAVIHGVLAQRHRLSPPSF